jgi:hypothetical protein
MLVNLESIYRELQDLKAIFFYFLKPTTMMIMFVV